MQIIERDTLSQIKMEGWQNRPEFARERLINANINPDSGLATDYLNVFNEAIMLLDLIEDMPDMLDELLGWRFLSYKEHFERSSFEAKELALEVYEAIDEHTRATLDEAAINLGQKIENTIVGLQSKISQGEDYKRFLRDLCGQIHVEIMTIDGIVHGQSQTNEQDDIDALFG